MAALVTAVGLLGLLNLLFTLGVIRRLRDYGRLLAPLLPGADRVSLAPGDTVPAGLPLELAAGTLVAFLAPGCEACAEQVPAFVAYASGLPPERVLAVLVGTSEAETAPLAGEVGGVASVLREEPDGPLQRAFAITGFPVYCLVGAGRTVTAAGTRVADLPAPAPEPAPPPVPR